MKKFLAFIFALFCLPSAYGAGCTNVSSAKNSGTAVTTLTVNYTPSSFAPGEYLVIGVAANAALTVSSVKDSTATYTFPLLSTGSEATGGTGSPLVVQMYGASIAGDSGITGITVSLTSNTIGVVVAEYSGVSGTGQLVWAGSASSVTTASTNVVTQAANNCLVTMFDTQGGTALTAGTGTLRQNGNESSNQYGFMENSTSSANTSLTTSVTWTTAVAFAAAGVELSTSTFNLSQTASGNPASGPSATFAQNVPVGDYVVALVFDGSGANLTTETITDSGSNTWTKVTVGGNLYCSLTSDGDTLAASYAKITTGGVLAITVQSVATTKRMMVIDLNGLAASALDKVTNCAYSASQTGGSALTTSTVTTTSANEMLIGFFGNAALGNFTAGTNYTLMNACSTSCGTSFTSMFTADEFRPVTAATGYTASMTNSVTSEMCGFGMTFVAASQPVISPGGTRGGPSIWGGGG